MKKLFFLFILGAFISIIQVTAQSNVPVADQSKEVSVNQEPIDKYNKSTVAIKNYWMMVDKRDKEPFFHLYVSTRDLAQKGIKVAGQAEAVPVYVKTDREYEPVLVKDKGKYNVEAAGLMSGQGFIVSTDGFIMTTRRVAAPWDSVVPFGENTPNGILMSADLKQVLEVNVPPPTKWVPFKTKSQQGKLGVLNLRVDFNSEYADRDMEYKVTPLERLYETVTADFVSSSINHDVSLLKIKPTSNLTPVELYDNYDQLQNGSTDLSFAYFNLLEEEYPGTWSLMKGEVSNLIKSEETGELIQIVNTLNNSVSSEAEKDKLDTSRIYFKAFAQSFSGTPIFDNQGRVIGIYLGYKADQDLHQVLPIRFGKKLFPGNW